VKTFIGHVISKDDIGELEWFDRGVTLLTVVCSMFSRYVRVIPILYIGCNAVDMDTYDVVLRYT
jgi:hypothetical protein